MSISILYIWYSTDEMLDRLWNDRGHGTNGQFGLDYSKECNCNVRINVEQDRSRLTACSVTTVRGLLAIRFTCGWRREGWKVGQSHTKLVGVSIAPPPQLCWAYSQAWSWGLFVRHKAFFGRRGEWATRSFKSCAVKNLFEDTYSKRIAGKHSRSCRSTDEDSKYRNPIYSCVRNSPKHRRYRWVDRKSNSRLHGPCSRLWSKF